jgi:predicted RND superfamily exporter protein
MPLRRLLTAISLTAVLLAVAIPRLRIEADVLSLLPAGLPELESLRTLQSQFQDEGKLTVALRFEDEDPDTLDEVAASLGSALRNEEGLIRTIDGDSVRDSLREAANSLGWMLVNAPPEEIENLRDRLSAGAIGKHLEEVIERMGVTLDMAELQLASYDPFELTKVAAMDLSDEDGPFSSFARGGSLKILEISPHEEEAVGYRAAHDWLKKIRQAMETWKATQANAGLPVPEILITGEPAYKAETGMGIEGDFSTTSAMTFILLSVLFLLVLRTLKLLANVMLMILITVGMTLAIGGLFFGSITAMSMGFVAVVQGLIVDYAALIYRHSMLHPELDAKGLRRRVRVSILGAAITTAAVFAALVFGEFPGLRQFGVLVACGTLIGAGVMLLVFTELAPRLTKEMKPSLKMPSMSWISSTSRLPAIITIVLISINLIVFAVRGFPHFEPGTESMRPRHSEALEAWEVIQGAMGKKSESVFPLLVEGNSAASLSGSIIGLQESFEQADGAYFGSLRWWFPDAFLPSADNQRENRATLEWLVTERSRLAAAADAAGFEPEALTLFDDVTDWLRDYYPTGGDAGGRYPGFIRRVLARDSGKWFALGTVTIETPADLSSPEDQRTWVRTRIKALNDLISKGSPGAQLSGWIPIGPAIAAAAKRDFLYESWPVGLALLTVLIVVFRRWRDVVLAIASLALALFTTLAVLRILNRPLNMANIAAFPLIAGIGIDYSLHMLIALREERNIEAVQHLIGKALVICALSSCIGFASLLTAGNRGVFDLGAACCVGLIVSTVIALGLLPFWWRWLHSK